MRYSNRLNSLPPYPFAEMERMMSEKRRKGIQLISFGIGDPDLHPPEFVNRAIIDGLRIPGSHNYSSSEGEQFFREAVVEWYQKRFGVSLDPNTQVCALIGSKEGLTNIVRSVVNPGERILVPNPSYPLYQQGGGLLNEVVPVDTILSHEKEFKPDLDKISKANFRLLFLNYPNNPTGTVIDVKFLEKIVKSVEDKDAYICYDNAYSEITFNDFRAPSILQVNSAIDKTIEFHSCSKTFAMTGYRIGFAVGSKDLINGLKSVKNQIDSGSPKFIQYAAAEALNQYSRSIPPKEVLEMVKNYEKRLHLLVNGLRTIGFNAKMPLGTFYLWLKVDDDSNSFASRLLDEGVVVTPGIGFGSGGEGYVRFSATVPEEQIERALEMMKSIRKN